MERNDSDGSRISFALLIAAACVGFAWALVTDLRNGARRLVRMALIAGWFAALAFGAIIMQWGERRMQSRWRISRAAGVLGMLAGALIVVIVWLLPIFLGSAEE